MAPINKDHRWAKSEDNKLAVSQTVLQLVGGHKTEYKIEKYAVINVRAVGGNNITTKISRFCV